MEDYHGLIERNERLGHEVLIAFLSCLQNGFVAINLLNHLQVNLELD